MGWRPVLTLLLALVHGAAWAGDGDEAPAIIVALAEHGQAPPAVGGTPRGSYGGGSYAAGLSSQAQAEALAVDYGLRADGAWAIAPLKLYCLQFRLAPEADVAAVLAALQRDPRVQLAQPSNEFETLAERSEPAYNDPYVGLQRGFAAMGVGEAQRWSRGEGVRVALIDTGLDADHPELAGRIDGQRDFAGADHPPPATGAERHGTQMAGVIAAAANNGQGIVGVAPQARLLAYRACWELAGAGGAARCSSFTLARALGAAIAAGADVINLSLAGPPDPLLARLTEYAIGRGIVVVGALPPAGARPGFPGDVAGVLAVRSSDDGPPSGPGLAAPGRDILTLAPGGRYDYATGSSLAAAQVSGTVALLRALSPGLSPAQAREDLAAPAAVASACLAVRRLRAQARCD